MSTDESSETLKLKAAEALKTFQELFYWETEWQSPHVRIRVGSKDIYYGLGLDRNAFRFLLGSLQKAAGGESDRFHNDAGEWLETLKITALNAVINRNMPPSSHHHQEIEKWCAQFIQLIEEIRGSGLVETVRPAPSRQR